MKKNQNTLRGQIGRWRLHWKWYALAALGFPVLAVVAAGLGWAGRSTAGPSA
ncbi:hypothetical protein [Methanocella paludicola]|uniref:hypothetical protein n=1 Tax=Methanocella paludicola TaxID=570267 RepID=UPI00130519EC|nr:hypothetical protein [Methanocella paludicola]